MSVTLADVLATMANQLGIAPETMQAYADEDTLGGYHTDDALRKWPMGSLWEVEGKVLYALTRALRPACIVEVGSWLGCSATHLLTALEANGKGKLISIDYDQNAGALIPETLRHRWRFIVAEGAAYISTHKLRANMVYEDAGHGLPDTIAILTAVREHIQPRLVISHDAMHFLVGSDIRGAWNAVYGAENYNTALIEPSDCGLAWRIEANER